MDNTKLLPGERFCFQCEHRWEDASNEYKLCPKCGSPTVIRPERLDTGLKVLELRGELYRVIAPFFEEAQRIPEKKFICANDATERALGVVLKRMCH